MSYTASNQKLIAEGRDLAIRAGNSIDGNFINTTSHGSLPGQTGNVKGGRTSMSMETKGLTGGISKMRWNANESETMHPANRSGAVPHKSLV